MSDPIPLAEEMSDNVALRSLVALTDLMLGELNQDYVGIDGTESVNITDTLSTLRAEDTTAKKTVVINLGSAAFRLYEADELVSYLEPLTTWVSPLTGKGLLTAKCAAEASSVASVTTYKNIATEPVVAPEDEAGITLSDFTEGDGIDLLETEGVLRISLDESVSDIIQVYPSIEGASGLESITTVGISDRIYWVRESGFTRGWRLSAGTAANNLAAGVWRPLDYHGTTNPKNFTREI